MTTPITVRAITTATPAEARAAFTDTAIIPQWNFAWEAWHCPEASSDLRTGGAFSYTMAARDGSMSFAYEGTWDVVEEGRLVQRLGDGRRVEITFTATDLGTEITETFDPDRDAPRAMQEAGWQAILNRFADVASTISADTATSKHAGALPTDPDA